MWWVFLNKARLTFLITRVRHCLEVSAHFGRASIVLHCIRWIAAVKCIYFLSSFYLILAFGFVFVFSYSSETSIFQLEIINFRRNVRNSTFSRILRSWRRKRRRGNNSSTKLNQNYKLQNWRYGLVSTSKYSLFLYLRSFFHFISPPLM